MANIHRPQLRGLGLLFAVASVPTVAGVRVQPMSYDLTPNGGTTKQDLRVENTSSTPTPVEMRVELREILPDGTDKRTPAEDDFLIFPPQAILPPNGFQTFRVQYIGDPTITQTKLYLITAAQLPVSGTGEQTSGIQIVYNVGTLAAVTPKGASAKIVITGVTPTTDGKKIEITVTNNGTRYARLRHGIWTLTSGNGKTEIVEGEALRNAIENSLIEPGKARIVQLPVSDGFKQDGAKADFKLSDDK